MERGRPSRVPSINPFMAAPIALPRISGLVISATTESDTPKKAEEATPVTTRPTAIVT